MRSQNGAERETGLKAVGRVPWGSHFCVFYETKQDLLDILVPYFRTGVANNEFCVCYVGVDEFNTVAEAKRRLGAKLPELGQWLKEGKMEIVSRPEWFWSNGKISLPTTLNRFRQKAAHALRHGFSGLRFHGGPAWLIAEAGESKFRDYEAKLDSMLANQPTICACTFPLFLTGAGQILDAARTHKFAVTVRNGAWNRVEINDADDAQRESWKGKLQGLTFRQREVLQLLAEGHNTKQIAALLTISVKTVETHRLQLMQRLNIHHVPGLVKFAIRSGLVPLRPLAA